MTNYRGGRRYVSDVAGVRSLRQTATDAERVLWRLLRGEGFASWKFRRQHRFGPFVLDFYCAAMQLAIEVDGGQHFEAATAAADAQRTQYLNARGVRVLRFTDTQILTERLTVAEHIRGALAGLSQAKGDPHPSPLPEGEGARR